MGRKFYLITSVPYAGPHERDTMNGFVYRFLAVDDDGVPSMPWLDHMFRDREPPPGARWSWSNAGIVAEDRCRAETWAADVFGDDFQGWVR